MKADASAVFIDRSPWAHYAGGMAVRVALTASLISLAVYLLTVSPTVGPVDSGELTLAAYHLDLAHPPGFPLYTLLGWAATRLGLAAPAYAANALSAVLGAGATGLLALALLRVCGSGTASVAAALCFALGRTTWSWATVAEVYSLQSLLLAGILALVLGSRPVRYVALGGFLFGLSMANHIGTALSVLPSLLILVPLAAVGLAAPLAFVGLSVYAYLPCRCAARPLFNWGNPCNLQRLVWHLTGKQYQVNLSLEGPDMLKELSAFGAAIPRQYPPWLLVIVGLGIVLMAVRWRRRALGLLVLVAGNLLYCLVYTIGQDKDAYYIPTFMALSVPLAAALSEAVRRLPRRMFPVIMVAPLVMGIRNWTPQDRSEFALAHNYALDALASVGPRGLLLTSDWQVYAPLLYLQEVERVSPDVASVDILLLKRTWYLDFLRRRWPALMGFGGDAVAEYSKLLHRFEYGLSYSPATIQLAYVALINSLIEAAGPATGGPAHVLGPMDRGVASGMRVMPRGIVERLLPDGEPLVFEEVDLHLETITGKDPSRAEVGAQIRAHYARMMSRQAAVLAHLGDAGRAREKEQLARRLAPPAPLPFRQ
jgi:hypothetical protein